MASAPPPLPTHPPSPKVYAGTETTSQDVTKHPGFVFLRMRLPLERGFAHVSFLCCGTAAETGGATEAGRRKSGDSSDSGQIGKMWSAVSTVQNRCHRFYITMEYSKKDLFC